MTHREVQQIAKDAMDFLRQNIHAGMTLEEVRRSATHGAIMRVQSF
ncbi:MAG: hypothetical protein J5930_04850 [Treponema sp.]|nr:hypothetical protein [Treponema sp.]